MKIPPSFTIGGLILALGGGIANAGVVFDPVTLDAKLDPSPSPGLLGPISVEGRTGWACAPEQAAGKPKAADAELPSDD
jgi:hypothetical protein